MILNFRESLNPQKMRFRDSLANEVSENWKIRESSSESLSAKESVED